MNIKTIKTNGYIALAINDPSKPDREKDVVAAATLFEGTGCWVVVDVRLSKHRQPSPYAGCLNADVLHAHHKPNSREEADFIKSKLIEFSEDHDGVISWCTYDDLVRGQSFINGYSPLSMNQPILFTYKGVLNELKQIKAFWDNYDGDPRAAKIDNPHRQPAETEIGFALTIREIERKRNTETDDAQMGM